MQPVLHGASSLVFESCAVEHYYSASSYVYANGRPLESDRQGMRWTSPRMDTMVPEEILILPVNENHQQDPQTECA